MKRIFIYITTAAMALTATAQSPIESIMESVSTHNNSIKSVQQEVTAAQTELSAENCLENPTFEFEYLWAEKQVPGGNKYGFAIMQGFDFPTLYSGRRKLINAQNSLGNSQVKLARQEVLLATRELCIKIVYLNKQIKLVNEREKIAQSLVKLYNQRLEAGDANQLEVNKVEIERISQSTRLKMLLSERDAAIASLIAYNGGNTLPVNATTLSQYPIISMPASLEDAVSQWRETDATMQTLRNQQLMAESYSSVARQGWIPRFEIGYKQAYEVGDMFYGLAVGVSLPLFKTNNEVKTAKARALALTWQTEETQSQVTAEATQLYKETCALKAALADYELLMVQNNRTLLVKALESGQISLLEYMSDIAQLNKAEENRLLIEYQYHSKLSQLNRNNL
ncbi:MAG: TolC family protein [Bacteroidaceae bacterium]|nr:TolC family protein [Bacteroidaceae bacterium]